MKRPISPIFRCIWIIIGLIAVIGLSRSLVDLWKRRDVVVERRQALGVVEKENARLKLALEESASPEFIEKQAREKLGMAKSDETVVLLTESTASSQIQNSINLQEQKPSWKLWWELFF